jgi:hypothetical protein
LIESIVKVALGTFACTAVETHLGPDLRAGVRTALAEYARRVKSGHRPLGVPPFGSAGARSGKEVLDLAVDEETMAIVEREADRQGTTPSQIVTHSVLLYLAELDRLSPVSPSSL